MEVIIRNGLVNKCGILETNMEHMPMLVSIVRCLASLCCIEDVVKFLDFMGGSRFFNSLIKCVVRCAASPGDMTRSSGKQSIKLEEATVNLLSQYVFSTTL